MKTVLLTSEKPFYKANLHCHSVNSDGKLTPFEIKERYTQMGYSVVAFTDHEHLLDNSYLNDENFLAITACELSIKQFPRLSTMTAKGMKVCHLNLYAKDPKNVDTPCYNSVSDHFKNPDIEPLIVHSCGEYERRYSGEGISEMIKIANENGFLVCYNHPTWSLENATDYLGYEGLWAVEIYNHGCFESGLFEYDIHAYDDFLRAGKRMACVAADDNHRLEETGGGFVMINADALEYTSIMDALEHHQFYASTGPIIKELYIEDGTAFLTFEKGMYATMTTAGRRSVKKVAHGDGETTVSFEILPEDGYVRFDLVDEKNRRANTNAFFL